MLGYKMNINYEIIEIKTINKVTRGNRFKFKIRKVKMKSENILNRIYMIISRSIQLYVISNIKSLLRFVSVVR